MKTTTEKLCRSCKYSVNFGAGTTLCDYMKKTGKRRECSVGECDKYEKRGMRKVKRSAKKEGAAG